MSSFGPSWRSLPKRQTRYGTTIGERPVIDYQQDTCVITREALDGVERRAACYRRAVRDREDGRVIAAIFMVGVLGLGWSLGMTAVMA